MTAPFGIEFFSDLSSLNVLQDFGQGKYSVSAPKPHPLLDTYVVQATPASGIVWIKATAPVKQIDAFGNALRADVDRIAQQLTQRYGGSRKTDLLFTGALWNEPQYWMNALEDGQRIYAFVWERKGQATLPDDLDTVYVGAAAYGGGTGATTVEYSSSRMAEAEREIEAGLSDLL
jgi:hypothetical protein